MVFIHTSFGYFLFSLSSPHSNWRRDISHSSNHEVWVERLDYSAGPVQYRRFFLTKWLATPITTPRICIPLSLSFQLLVLLLICWLRSTHGTPPWFSLGSLQRLQKRVPESFDKDSSVPSWEIKSRDVVAALLQKKSIPSSISIASRIGKHSQYGSKMSSPLLLRDGLSDRPQPKTKDWQEVSSQS